MIVSLALSLQTKDYKILNEKAVALLGDISSIPFQPVVPVSL
jgi:hypothetical protein